MWIFAGNTATSMSPHPDFRDTADYTSARGRGRYGSMMLTWNGVLKK
jgi:hypothetical protein